MHTEEQLSNPIEPVQETPAATLPAVKEEVPETKSETPEPAKPKTRITKSVVFKPEEHEYLEQVINARKEAGRTNDWNHFIRQCIEFTVNNQEDWEFAIPKHLKNKTHFE